MPLPIGEHDVLLTELMETTDEARKVELSTQLRSDYQGVVTDFSKIETESEKLTQLNEDLRTANAVLWRSQGPTVDPATPENTKKFSETATLEDIESKFR